MTILLTLSDFITQTFEQDHLFSRIQSDQQIKLQQEEQNETPMLIEQRQPHETQLFTQQQHKSMQ